MIYATSMYAYTVSKYQSFAGYLSEFYVVTINDENDFDYFESSSAICIIIVV